MITSREELLTAIKAGETRLELADGEYGALTISRRGDLVVAGGPGAVVSSIYVGEASRVVLDGFSVRYAAPSIVANAARVYDSSDVTISNLHMRGLLVAEGTLNARHVTDVPQPGQNAFLVGYHAGRAISLESVDGVTVEGCDIEGFFSGINFGGRGVGVVHNRISDLRTTAIKGGASDLLIQSNQIGHSTPYRYTSLITGAELGDHLDGIHIYTAEGQHLTSVVVRENLIDASEGFDMLGINLQAKIGGSITGSVEDNTVITGNNQAIVLSQRVTANVDRNKVHAPPGSAKPACIVINDRALVTMTGNVAAESSTKPSMASSYPDNTWLPRVSATVEVIDAARSAWMVEYRPEPLPEPDPRDVEIERLTAELTATQTALTVAVEGNAALQAGFDAVTRERDELALWAATVRAAVAS